MQSSESHAIDPKTDAAYWDIHYPPDSVPSRIEPARATYLERRLHDLLARTLAPRRGQRLLEIGCGGSRWLPYFAVEHGLKVTGVDYAPLGCALARRVLDKEGIKGEIFEADALAENATLQGRFDIIFSYGVVEHFSDTSACIGAFRQYLKPGGIAITTIPNLTGALGSLQKRLNRPVYDKHVPITREQLAAAHAAAGMRVVESGYLGCCDFHVLHIGGVPATGLAGMTVHAVTRAAYRVSRIAWGIERVLPWTPGRVLAPMVFCVATVNGSPS